MAEDVSPLRIQVCYAEPERQLLQDMTVPVGTTLQEAILQSGILNALPGLDITTLKLGVYGKSKPLDTVLRDQDRVEIYRPLLADPKEARRKRAEKKNRQNE